MLGANPASRAPKSNLTAVKEPKLLHAAPTAQRAPQTAIYSGNVMLGPMRAVSMVPGTD